MLFRTFELQSRHAHYTPGRIIHEILRYLISFFIRNSGTENAADDDDRKEIAVEKQTGGSYVVSASRSRVWHASEDTSSVSDHAKVDPQVGLDPSREGRHDGEVGRPHSLRQHRTLAQTHLLARRSHGWR